MKFRKKPVVIEAYQWTGNVRDLTMWATHADMESRRARGALQNDVELPLRLAYLGNNVIVLKVSTLEGEMTVSPDDWVICGLGGEFYPCKPEIFAKTYELVE